MRRILAILLMIIILPASADPAYVICSPESFVWMRTQPKFRAQEAGYLYAGDMVETDGRRSGNWVHVLCDTNESGDGWVYSGYLVGDKPEIYQSGMDATTTKGKVRVRQYAGGKITKTLKKGTKLTAYVVSSEWTLTDAGFIKTELLEFTDPEE